MPPCFYPILLPGHYSYAPDMSIWFNKKINLDDLKSMSHHSMSDYLGIEWTEAGDDYLKARMPVNEKTKQPLGLLHGGASCVLAETLGSIASYLVIDISIFSCVGLEINANHIRTVKEGYITGEVRPLHIGKTTHVWDIRIYDEAYQLVCVSRLTVAILRHKH